MSPPKKQVFAVDNMGMDEQEQPRTRRKPGPKPGVQRKAAETKEEREKRDYLIFARFLSGHSEREIGHSVGLTGQRVHQIIKAELGSAARHHKLLVDELLPIHMSRIEFLLKAVMPKALQQDLKAVAEARALMDQQTRLVTAILAATAVPPMPGTGGEPEEEPDELTRFRMQKKSRGSETSG